MKKVIKITIFALVIFLTLSNSSHAAITRLDDGFGEEGYVEFDVPSYQRAACIKVQSDGKYIVAAQSNNDLLVLRYMEDGTLDTTYNAPNGFLLYDSGGTDYASSCFLQDNGKFVVVGYSDGDMIIMRYLEDGTLDTSFNSPNGYVTFDSGLYDVGTSIKMQYDGKYIVSGYISDYLTPLHSLVLWRYSSDGNIDISFNSPLGYKILDQSDYYSSLASVNLLKDKYIALGYKDTTKSLLLYRLNRNGEFDTSFGISGSVTITTEANISNMSDNMFIQEDGKIVITGGKEVSSGDYDIFVWRYNKDGSLDTSFGKEGYVSHHSAAGGEDYDNGHEVIVQSNGKIVVSGRSNKTDGDPAMTIWKFNSDGTLDTSFNEQGYLFYDSGKFEVGHSLAIDSKGRYVIGTGDYSLRLYRYENLYQIDSLGTDLEAKVGEVVVETDTVNGVYGSNIINVNKGNVRIVDVVTEMIEDRNWSGVIADSSLLTYSSFASGVVDADGTFDTFSLYVPKRDGDEGVGICPGASQLSEVNCQCPDIYYLSGDDSNVSEVTIDNINYWKVDGLTGTGGFSVAELPETGSSISMLYVVGVILVAVYSIRQRRIRLWRILYKYSF